MSFSAALRAMDAELLDAFGEPADYRAGGAGAPRRVPVVPERATAEGFSQGAALRSNRAVQLWFGAADVPAPRKGDTFTLLETGEVVALAGAPRRDKSGNLWIGDAQ